MRTIERRVIHLRPTSMIPKLAVTALLISLAFSIQAMDGEGLDLAAEADPGTVPVYIEHSRSDHFIENGGQIDDEILLHSSTEWGSIGLGSDGFYINARSYDRDRIDGHVIKFEMVGQSSSGPEGIHTLDHGTNYILGDDPEDWAIGMQSYRKAVYRDIWNDIDLFLERESDCLKYEFRMDPWTDVELINFKVIGYESLIVDKDEIRIGLSNGMEIVDGPLVSFYSDGEREWIDSCFHVKEDGSVGIELENYDMSRPVTIDPLIFSGYLGGTNADVMNCIEIDHSNNILAAGSTQSNDFPATTGAYSSSLSGASDVFITKINHNGTKILSSTYFGGSSQELLAGMKVDSQGNVHIAGETHSTNFPTKTGAYDTTHNGGSDLFVSCLSSDLKSLLRSTYIGSTNWENNGFIDLDSDDRPVIMAQTMGTDFPTTNGSYENESSGQRDVVIFKLEKDYSSLNFSTYIGGSWWETPSSMKVASDGSIYGLAYTFSFDFPTTNGSYRETAYGTGDAIVFRFDHNCSNLLNSSYFGGNSQDHPGTLNLDENGTVVISGHTFSNNLPVTSNAYSTKLKGMFDVYVARFSSDLSDLLACTYFGGTNSDSICWSTIDDDGDVIGFFQTISTDLPVVYGSYNLKITGTNDLCVFRIDGNLSKVDYCTYMGGSDMFQEMSSAIIKGKNDTVILLGRTSATDFPATSGSFDNTSNGGSDGVIVCMDLKYRPLPPINISGTLGKGWVNLTWDEPDQKEDYEIDSYVVYYGNSSHEIAFSGWANGTEHFNQSVTTGEDHFFQLITRARAEHSDMSKVFFIRDEIKPGLSLPDIPAALGTGDKYNFTIDVWDDIMIKNVRIDYTYYLGAKGNISMDTLDGTTYYYNMTVFDTNSNMTLKFFVQDMYRNWIETDEFFIDVIDNDLPVILDDMTPSITSTKKQLSFEIRAWDNIGIDEVWVQYELPGLDVKVRKMEIVTSNHYKHTIGIPNVIGELEYEFHLLDRSGNWMNDSGAVVLIEDLIDPSIQEIHFPETATTGEKISIVVNTTDNIGVDRVILNYRYGQGESTSIDMDISGENLWSIEITIIDTIEDLLFSILSVDGSLNNKTSDELSIDVIDNDRPELIEDLSKDTASAGEDFDVMVRIQDNILVKEAYIEYWFNGHDSFNISMDSDNGTDWMRTITIPNKLEPMRYVIRMADGSGNWNMTGQRMVLIYDLVPPELLDLEWIDEPTTGDLCLLKVNALDNVELSRVDILYRFKGNLWLELNTTNEGDGSHSATVFIEKDALQVAVMARAYDSSENAIETKILTSDVMDNDPPVSDLTEIPTRVLSDHQLNFTFPAHDNLGIGSITMRYWIYKENVTTEFLDAIEGNVSVSVPIEHGAEPKNLKIEITIDDISGNIWESGILSRIIEDGTDPHIEGIDPQTIYQGEDLILILNSTDDRTKVETEWSFLDDVAVGKEVVIIGDIPGEHLLTAIATDASGNTFVLEVPITVLPKDHDRDRDGIPDLNEMEMELDPYDPSDASEDDDLDGLTNLEEYLNRTKHDDPDTDKDGMDDEWEIRYGLNPRKDTADQDTDGDGRTDLEEYLDGTDPTVKDKGMPVIPIIIISVVIVLIAGIILSLIFLKKKEKEEGEAGKTDDGIEANPYYQKNAPSDDLKAAPSLDEVLDNQGGTTDNAKTGTLENGTGYIRPEDSKDIPEE